MKEAPDLSIIIVNWNTAHLLSNCLSAIEQTVIAAGQISSETLVVDNGSTDGSPAMLRERHPWAHLIANRENVGFARANNQAIAVSRGRYALLLNSDAQLVPGAVEAMVACLDADPTAGISGVCQVFADGRPQFCYGRFPTFWREVRTLTGLHRWDLSPFDTLEQPRVVDWVSGACLMARRSMLDEIGLMDERFFMFGEEVDLCYRATRAGWKVLLTPSAPIIHIRAGSSGRTPERMMRLYRGKMQYARKHWSPASASLLLAAIRFSTFAKGCASELASALRGDPANDNRLWRKVANGVREEGFAK
ncbi:MAG: glycosyltransferase family 2 protein [Anaerolineae bacterium]|nr:glycosyltransferase family 2 protein [Anaerolineae bacterium]